MLPPASYTSARRCVRIPIEPKTIGDHIRKKRLSMKLLSMKLRQKDVADRCQHADDLELGKRWGCC